ncbi:pre-toxin TG domain-containing protein [Nocardia otitidiscaviarum]|uniref:pre-toxin TG domain-containing protein n=1 Tax=Nocardia otitidiscaviarum TaxID=1823 RepID=UPI0004A7739A|nr:pre-toxin TG domain-containing protein [Nocardia otitidiscaviarum]MBF6485660.1 pre-toxin TG domain-containing protein [Nocardia otitidiscaviarum]
MAGLAQYKAALARRERQFEQSLLSGKANPTVLALRRKTVEILRHELTYAPKSVLVWEQASPTGRFGFSGPQRWVQSASRKADKALFPSYATPRQHARKRGEYLDYAREMLRWGQVEPEVFEDDQRGVRYLILGADPLVADIMRALADELLDWFDRQPNDKRLARWPPRLGFAQMLHERPDLGMLLRLSQSLPLDVEVSSIPVDRPAFVEVVELGIGLIPVVGNIVAVYEAWAGEDLFGYKLTDVERGILAASALLPTAGRLVKGGRALYRESRLVAMYGSDAAGWSKATGASARAGQRREAMRVVDRAEERVRGGGSLTGSLLEDSADAVPALARGGTPRLDTAVSTEIEELFEELSSAHPALRDLDDLAIERVLARGPNVNQLKGQLLEELVESRLVPWLPTREGGFALGITVPHGKKLEFVPGHLIRDADGRQITDGVLAYREDGAVVIAAVFEAKAGRNAARELSVGRGGLSSLTDDELAELRAHAKDVWKDQRDAARAAGEPFTTTLDDVMKQHIQTELGGQVRRDIERLAAGTTGASQLRIADQTVPISFSPVQTKFFGVVPRDLPRRTIRSLERQLGAQSVTFEILGVDISGTDLTAIADRLRPLAEKLAHAAP